MVIVLLLLLLLVVVLLGLGGVWCTITQSLTGHPCKVCMWQVVLLVACGMWC
jgi:hypothetical protein